MKHLVALIALALSAGPAEAAMIHGLGTKSCGTWTSEHRENDIPAVATDAWVGGFISAYNIWGPEKTGDIAGHADFKGMIAWITNYCTANPLDDVSTASIKLVEELYKRKTR